MLLSHKKSVHITNCAIAHKDSKLPHKTNKHGEKLTKTYKVIKIWKRLKIEMLAKKLQPFKDNNT
jgi:hypothetical protein